MMSLCVFASEHQRGARCGVGHGRGSSSDGGDSAGDRGGLKEGIAGD